MRVRELVYAGSIAIASAIALGTPLWWAALAVFVVAEGAITLIERRASRVAPVIRLPQRDARSDLERRAA